MKKLDEYKLEMSNREEKLKEALKKEYENKITELERKVRDF